MKFIHIAILALFLMGCTERVPGSFEARVTGLFYRDSDQGRKEWVEVYSGKYGIVNIYGSPYYKTVKNGERVMVGCGQTNGHADDCRILGAINESDEKGK